MESFKKGQRNNTRKNNSENVVLVRPVSFLVHKFRTWVRKTTKMSPFQANRHRCWTTRQTYRILSPCTRKKRTVLKGASFVGTVRDLRANTGCLDVFPAMLKNVRNVQRKTLNGTTKTWDLDLLFAKVVLTLNQNLGKELNFKNRKKNYDFVTMEKGRRNILLGRKRDQVDIGETPNKKIRKLNFKEDIRPKETNNIHPLLPTENKNSENLEKVLDIDKLHEIMEPPSDVEEIYKKKSPLSDHHSSLRRSERPKKALTGSITVINCHQCKKIDSTFNTLTCGNEMCRESFCFKCLRNYYVIFQF